MPGTKRGGHRKGFAYRSDCNWIGNGKTQKGGHRRCEKNSTVHPIETEADARSLIRVEEIGGELESDMPFYRA
jgi:hypothetical protein